MRLTHIQMPKRIGITAITTVAVAALSVPLFNWLPVEAANTAGASNVLVTVNATNTGAGNVGSNITAVSEDGNIVAFNSSATDLTSPAGPSAIRPYLRNISAGTTVRIDTSASGVVGNDSSQVSALSRNGRYAVFYSRATNLIDGTTIAPSGQPFYLKDLQTGVVSLLSDPSEPPRAANAGISGLSISDDGRYAFFRTKYAAYYIPGLRTGYADIIMLDRVKNTWALVNTPATGALQNVDVGAGSYGASKISCDGALMVFWSTATNLVPGYSGSGYHLYIADMRNGIHITDITPGATADSYAGQISCSGRYVTFITRDRTFVSPTPSGMDSDYHVVRYDRITGERQYVDSNSSGSFAPGVGFYSSVSDKGDTLVRYSTFATFGYKSRVYLKHLSDGSGTLETFQKNATTGAEYPYEDSSDNALLSSNGKYIVYRTKQTDSLGLTTSNGSIEQIVRTTTGL